MTGVYYFTKNMTTPTLNTKSMHSTLLIKVKKTHTHLSSNTNYQRASEMDSMIFSIATSSVSFIGAILCCAVLFLLRTNRQSKQKNSILIKILVSFCLVENICFTVLWGSFYMFKDQSIRDAVRRFFFIACTGIYQMFVFSLVAMTVDRSIAFFRPFKYKKMVTHSRLCKYYCGTLLLTIAVRIPFLIGWSSLSLSWLFQIDIVLETVLLLPQPFIYVALYKKWKSNRSRLATVSHNNIRYQVSDTQKIKRRQAEYITFIVLSVILFVTCLAQVFSDVLHITAGHLSTSYTAERIMGYMSNALWIFVVFITPLCHVFVRPSVRHRFNSTMRRSIRSLSKHSSSVRNAGSTTAIYELKERDVTPAMITFMNSPYPTRFNKI